MTVTCSLPAPSGPSTWWVCRDLSWNCLSVAVDRPRAVSSLRHHRGTPSRSSAEWWRWRLPIRSVPWSDRNFVPLDQPVDVAGSCPSFQLPPSAFTHLCRMPAEDGHGALLLFGLYPQGVVGGEEHLGLVVGPLEDLGCLRALFNRTRSITILNWRAMIVLLSTPFSSKPSRTIWFRSSASLRLCRLWLTVARSTRGL